MKHGILLYDACDGEWLHGTQVMQLNRTRMTRMRLIYTVFLSVVTRCIRVIRVLIHFGLQDSSP
jgi:hypothetical protein